MKGIFVGPEGIRAGWRFAIFVFLLFGFSKLFYWLLTVLFHFQEHAGLVASRVSVAAADITAAALPFMS
jgi:hypothetical protein